MINWIRSLPWRDICIVTAFLIVGIAIGVGTYWYRTRSHTCYRYVFATCSDYSSCTWFTSANFNDWKSATEVADTMMKYSNDKGDYLLTQHPLIVKCNCQDQ